MSRKYSQYRLPQPSELVESDDEEDQNQNVFSHSTHRSISNLSENKEHDLKNDNDQYEDEDEEEEDEDLLSESVILHKMPSSTRKQVSFFSNPIEEISHIQMDKALFIDIFDQYFDESQEGDVDYSEFSKGLIALGVNISETMMINLFETLLMHNNDDINNKYLQSEQFSDFLTRKFDAPQLVAFQSLLLDVIKTKTKKNPTRSTLMKAQDATKWDVAEVNLAEIEMRQAMEQMVDNEMVKIKIKQEFNEELERRIADPSFCNDANAQNWDSYEVTYWVSKAIGHGYDDILKRRFFDGNIDGNVLLYDVDAAMLRDFGISQLHINKAMRMLSELRQKLNKHLIEEYDLNNVDIMSQNNEKLDKMKQKLDEIIYLKQQIENESNEKMTKMEQKYLSSQQEIISLQSAMNETKQSHIEKVQKLNEKLIDFDSMKHSFDDVCTKLNVSKQRVIELEQKLKECKDRCIKVPSLNAEDQNNPYLAADLSQSIKVNRPKIATNHDYVQQLEAKANENSDFCMDENAAKWSVQEVAYWLIRIGMKTYLVYFIEQFVDGQILLNDVSQNNLISDLGVKSLHAPKIMREVKKLKKKMYNLYTYDLTLNVTDFVIESTQNSLLQTYKLETNSLKNDLSETRIKLNALHIKLENEQRRRKSSINVPSLPNMSPTSSINSVTDQSSVNHNYTNSMHSEGNFKKSVLGSIGYNDNDLQKSPPSDPLSENWKKYFANLEKRNREILTLFHRSDNALKGYKKAIIPFQERINNLEIQNQTREKTINKLNKRIERRNESIKKLKDQIAATMYTPPINAQVGMPSMTKQMSHTSLNSSFVSDVSPPQVAQQESLTPEQEQYFNNVQRHYNNMEQQQQTMQMRSLQRQQQQAPPYVNSRGVKQPKKSKKMRRSRNNINGGNAMRKGRNFDYGSSASYHDHQSDVGSAVSSNSKNKDDSSIIGAVASTAWGYFMGSGSTPQ